MFSWETGEPGVFRFFVAPLGAEMSWLLPFALFSLIVIAIQSKVKISVESGAHLGLILWGGWLMTCVVFFSMISGIFHAYYVVMLAPALGAVVGGGFGYLWQRQTTSHAGSGWLLTLGAASTVAFQIYLAWQYGVNEIWMPLAFGLVALATFLLFVSLLKPANWLQRAAFTLLISAMLIVPLAWSVLTVTRGSDSNLPAAYGVNGNGQRVYGDGAIRAAAPAQVQQDAVGDSLLEFLQSNTQGMKYLVAVESSQVGAPFVIATERPVLYMGGFNGSDEVISADGLAQMVFDGELRFVLFGRDGRNNKQDVVQWLQGSCSVVSQFNQQGVGSSQPQGPNQGGQILYDCQ
jgi:4-amino-4-deoxy-L-arabinose transferase-like glycosyltransferase